MKERRPLGNVLVATDFSPAATGAVQRAAALPIGPGATLTVLHVLPVAAGAEERAGAERALADAASVAREAAARGGRRDLDVLARLADGTAFVEIIRGGRHGRNELIVLGRHGERSFRELVLGSTAERVIRKGDTSILVVAARPDGPYVRPLVAVDGSETSRRAVELAWRLAGPEVSALDVVHAYAPIPESAIRRAGFTGERAREYQLEARRETTIGIAGFLSAGDGPPTGSLVVRDGDPRPAILGAAAEAGADLLALGTHGRSGIEHLLLGSVAEAVIRGATCDVVVARAVGLPFKLP
jgi:nucleotide-binding universal stress UspA family protein